MKCKPFNLKQRRADDDDEQTQKLKLNKVQINLLSSMQWFMHTCFLPLRENYTTNNNMTRAIS